jgi:hypothetical protein
MRYAGLFQKGSPDSSDVLIAATPEEMRGILDKLKMRALQGDIPAEAFSRGLFEVSEGAQSPNSIGRHIRNTLKNPLARTLVDNPDMAENLANTMSGQLDRFGFNSDSMKGLIGPGMDILRQAKKDNLLKQDVSDDLIAEKIQRPLYEAYRGFMKDNRNDSRLNDLILEYSPGIRGPGTPLELFGDARKFGIEPKYFTNDGTMTPLEMMK